MKMSSPAFKVEHKKYVGTGSADPVLVNCQFRPQRVEIKSLEGQVVLTERMPGAWHAVNGAAAAYLGDTELVFTDTGIEIKSTDVVLNKLNTEYFVEMY